MDVQLSNRPQPLLSPCLCFPSSLASGVFTGAVATARVRAGLTFSRSALGGGRGGAGWAASAAGGVREEGSGVGQEGEGTAEQRSQHQP